MDDASFGKAFAILWRRFRIGNWAEGRHPFEVLVSIIVSQNSTDLVTERVMRDLSRQMPVRPKEVAAASPQFLVRTLGPAGLSRQKVPRIRALAREVVRRFGGDAMRVLDEPNPRQTLIDLPGIGPKTADVWLSLVAGRDTMPVDTHIARLARRWRLVRRADYEHITAKLKSLIPPNRRARGHLVLIQFGREVCQARRPRCERSLRRRREAAARRTTWRDGRHLPRRFKRQYRTFKDGSAFPRVSRRCRNMTSSS